MLIKDNQCVHGLWIGTRLSQLELLCIQSFIYNGHTFILWAYEPLENDIPGGCQVRDANEIIPRSRIFSYINKNQFGHGKGSYAGFSDIFRYKLLYEYGGWWADMDVSCLRTPDFDTPYVFRTHHDLRVVGNIMKCPPKSALMKRCYERAVAEVHADNRDWNKPIRILNDAIEELGLQQYIVEMSNSDSWNDVRKMITGRKEIPGNWYVIHWVNEEWRRNGINKDYSGKNSLLRDLYTRYGVPVKKLKLKVRFMNRLKLSFPLSAIKIVLSAAWGHVAYYLKRHPMDGGR